MTDTIRPLDRLEERLLLAGDIDFSYGDFSDLTGLSLRATTFQDGDDLQLNAASSSVTGAVWHTTSFAVQPNTSFNTSFVYRATADQFSDTGGDGFAFVIQSDGANTDPTQPGDSLGYRNLDNSLAIEFDMRQSNGDDPSPEHIGVNINGRSFDHLATTDPALDLNDGSDRYVWIDYDGTTNVLDVFLADNATKPTGATLTTNVNLNTLIDGDEAWAGFTAATSGFVGSHTLDRWAMTSDEGDSGGDNTGTTNLLRFVNFNDTTGLSFVEDADANRGFLRLTKRISGQRGAAWFNTPMTLTGDTGFNTAFSFRLDGGDQFQRGEGFAFVLQSNGTDAISPFVGNSLGYANIANSVAIEFDTFNSGGSEVSGNHIALHVNGNRFNAFNNNAVDATPLFNSGERLFAWVEYDGEAKTLNVFYNSTAQKPATPALSANINLANYLDDDVYAGFTAATSGRTNAHLIQNWGLNVVEPDTGGQGGTFNFATETITVGENVGDVYLRIDRTGDTTGSARLTFDTIDGTATRGDDFGFPFRQVDFADGQARKSVLLRVIDDTVDEADEAFQVKLIATSNGTVGNADTVDVTITDNDDGSTNDPGEFNFELDQITVGEDAGNTYLRILRTGGTDGPAVVRAGVELGTGDAAASNDDFNFPFTDIEFADGQARKSVLVRVLDDDLDEQTESLTVRLLSTTAGTIGAQDALAFSITDNDETQSNPGTFNLDPALVSVNEGAGSATVRVVRTGGSDGAATVELGLDLSGSASAADLNFPNRTLNFADGQTEATTTVSLVNDDEVEGDETFGVTLLSTTAGTVGNADRLDVTIVDDDSTTTNPGTFNFATGSMTVDEDAGTVEFTVNRSVGEDGPVTVNLGFSLGTAEAADFNFPNRTLTFADGQSSATGSFNIVDDDLNEPAETFTLLIDSVSAGAIGGTNSMLVTINPSDEVVTNPEVEFQIDSTTVNEDAGEVTLTLRRTAGTAAFTARVETSELSANDPADYLGVNEVIEFDENENQKTVTIPIVDDASNEGTEKFTVAITEVTGGTAGTRSAVEVTIIDNDQPPITGDFINKDQLGVNLEKLGTATTQWDFADLTKNADRWVYTGSDARAGQPTPTDDNGYPVLLAGEQARSVLRGWGNGVTDVVPAGQYTLTWKGTGKVQVAGWVNTPVQDSAGGDSTYQFNLPRIDGRGASVRVNIVESDPNDPITDIHLYMPGYAPGEPNENLTYHQQFTQFLEPVRLLRVMDWMNGPTNDTERWADRSTPNTFSYATAGDGVSVNAIVDLANESDSDIWVNIPARANDFYVRQFAAYLANNLEAGRQVYVEYGNEVWAPTVGGNAANAVGYNYITERIADTGAERIDQWAEEMERDFAIVKQEFGGQSDRVIRVAAGQARNRNSVNRQLLEALAADGSLDADLLGLAAYVRADPALVGQQWNNPQTNPPSVEDIFQVLYNDLNQQVNDEIISGGSLDGQKTGLWSWHRQLADEFGLDLYAYEGGQQLTPNSQNRTWYDNYVAAQKDPRMGELYADLLHAYLGGAGGDAYIHYASVGLINAFGAWGLKEGQLQPVDQAPKWQSVLGYSLTGIKFEQWTYETTEGTAVQLELVRTGDTSDAYSVRLKTRDLTAEAGSDYQAFNSTVTFAAGETAKTVTLTINNDNVWEAPERFRVDASTTDDALSLGSALVKIADNDQPSNGLNNRGLLGVNTEKLEETAAEWNFTDMVHNAFPWQYPQGHPQEFERVPVNASGYPVLEQDESAFSFVRTRISEYWGANFPEGNYTLTWQGRGTIEVSNGKESNPNAVSYSFTSTGGTNRETIFLTGDMMRDDNITLLIRNNGGNDNIRNIHLYMPGYGPGEANAGKLFHEDMFDSLQPYSIMRYMDWFNTNLNPVEDWDDRITPNEVYSYYAAGRGVPIEAIVEHANQGLLHPWINMPPRANDGYVRNLAQYVKDNLDPRLTVYLEYGNEVWAPTVGGRGDLAVNYNYITERINETGRDPLQNQSRIDQWAEEIRRDFDIWMDVYGEDQDRLVRVAAGQGRNRNTVNEQLLAALTQYGTKDVDVFAPAAYIRVNDFAKLATWNDGSVIPTVDDVFDELFEDLDRSVNPQIATTGSAQGQPIGNWNWHKSLADKYDVKLIAYEGGQQLFTNAQAPEWTEVMAQAQQDPRMYDLYEQILEKYLVEIGADGFVHYTSTGSITPFGGWGALEYTGQPLEDAPKYRAIYEFANGAKFELDNNRRFDEDAGNVTGTITRLGPSQAPVSIRLRTSNGNATAGVDYTALDQVFTLGQGQASRVVSIGLTDDNDAEGNEFFTVTASYPSAPGGGFDIRQNVVIVDND